MEEAHRTSGRERERKEGRMISRKEAHEGVRERRRYCFWVAFSIEDIAKSYS